MAKKSKSKSKAAPKSIKKGGSGTAVGNLLRKVSTPVKKVVKAAGQAYAPRATASVALASKILQKKPKTPNLVQTGPLSPQLKQLQAIQGAARDQRRVQENAMVARYQATGQSQFKTPDLSMPDYGNDFSDNAYVPNDGEEGGFTVSPGAGPSAFARQTQKNQNNNRGITSTPYSYGGGFGGAYEDGGDMGMEEGPTTSMERSGVFGRAAFGTPAGTGAGVGVGQPTYGGGERDAYLSSIGLEDPVYKNLIRQLRAESQLDVDEEDVRNKVLRQYQTQINSINSVYNDMIGRAEIRGNQREGSERALQARSGILGNDFGFSAMERVQGVETEEIGDINNQRQAALSEIYTASRNEAGNEINRLRELKRSGAEGYLEALTKEREVLDTGLQDIVDRLVSQGFTPEDLGDKFLRDVAKDWKTTPNAVYNKLVQRHATAAEEQLALEETMAGIDKTRGGAGDEEGNFDQFSNEAIAFSVLPVQIRNSDAEREYFMGGIRQGLAQGLDPYTIADNLMGYKVSNPDDFSDNMRQLIGQSELKPADISNVARFINSGDKARALKIIENSIMAKARKENPDGYVSEPTARTASRRVSELAGYLNKAGAPYGIVKGTMQKWLGKLKGKDASIIQNQITKLVAQMRKDLSGSAVTEYEGRFLAPLIPDLNDRPDVFMEKLEQLGIEPLQELNAIRQTYGLANLDNNSLLNDANRVNLYYGFNLGPQTGGFSGGESSGGSFDDDW